MLKVITTWMELDEHLNTCYGTVSFTPLKCKVMNFLLSIILFCLGLFVPECFFSQSELGFMLYRMENAFIERKTYSIERMFSEENVFQLNYGFVCRATTEGPCTGF